VTTQQLSNLVSSDSTWKSFENERFVEAYEKLKREKGRLYKISYPGIQQYYKRCFSRK
ncbi:hypothetical protein MKW92_024362, partial [Papaver armeniacum]